MENIKIGDKFTYNNHTLELVGEDNKLYQFNVINDNSSTPYPLPLDKIAFQKAINNNKIQQINEMKIRVNNLTEIKRMQKLAGITECGMGIPGGLNQPKEDDMNEIDSETVQGIAGAAIVGGVTIAVAVKSLVKYYKEAKSSNPKISTADAIKQALSKVGDSIGGAGQ